MKDFACADKYKIKLVWPFFGNFGIGKLNRLDWRERKKNDDRVCALCVSVYIPVSGIYEIKYLQWLNNPIDAAIRIKQYLSEIDVSRIKMLSHCKNLYPNDKFGLMLSLMFVIICVCVNVWVTLNKYSQSSPNHSK